MMHELATNVLIYIMKWDVSDDFPFYFFPTQRGKALRSLIPAANRLKQS